MALSRFIRKNGRVNWSFASSWVVQMSSSSGHVPKSDPNLILDEDACPQGIQGDVKDDQVTFSLWLDTCRRYGLSNCNQQLQGIQTGRKTIAQVMAEQEKLIVDIAAHYHKAQRQGDVQGIQEDMLAYPDISMPCPQGIQGEDCARFKLWLENCNRFGFTNCIQQLQGFHDNRKTLAQIFEEQDEAIKKAATFVQQQRQGTETSSRPDGAGRESAQEVAGTLDADTGTGRLSYRQKFRRAVKEYGTTVMVFHISISLASLGFFYMLVSSGIDVVGIVSRLGVPEESLQAKLASGTGTFVVAYAVHKVFAPARIALTLTATPLIVRYLHRIGFLKAAKPQR